MGDVLAKLEKLVEQEVDKIVAKGNMSPSELEMASKAVCLIEKIKMIDEIDSDYDSEGSYSRGYDRSYRRGRSYDSRDRWQDRGRDYYSMDRGYSGHSVKDRMIAHLESTMMDEAQSDSERRTIEALIGQLNTTK